MIAARAEVDLLAVSRAIAGPFYNHKSDFKVYWIEKLLPPPIDFSLLRKIFSRVERNYPRLSLSRKLITEHLSHWKQLQILGLIINVASYHLKIIIMNPRDLILESLENFETQKIVFELRTTKRKFFIN
jgi:hypothetical protein